MSTAQVTPDSGYGKVNANIIDAVGARRVQINGPRREGALLEETGIAAQGDDIAASDPTQPDVRDLFAPEGGNAGEGWTTNQTTAVAEAFALGDDADFAQVRQFLAEHQALHFSDGVILLRTAEGGEVAFLPDGSIERDGVTVDDPATLATEFARGIDGAGDGLERDPEWSGAGTMPKDPVAFSDEQVAMLCALQGIETSPGSISADDRMAAAQLAATLGAWRISAEGVVVIDLDPDDAGQLDIPRTLAITADGEISYGADPEQSIATADDIINWRHSAQMIEMRERLGELSPTMALANSRHLGSPGDVLEQDPFADERSLSDMQFDAPVLDGAEEAGASPIERAFGEELAASGGERVLLDVDEDANVVYDTDVAAIYLETSDEPPGYALMTIDGQEVDLDDPAIWDMLRQWYQEREVHRQMERDTGLDPGSPEIDAVPSPGSPEI